jgi:hypothetical protein
MGRKNFFLIKGNIHYIHFVDYLIHLNYRARPFLFPRAKILPPLTKKYDICHIFNSSRNRINLREIPLFTEKNAYHCVKLPEKSGDFFEKS